MESCQSFKNNHCIQTFLNQLNWKTTIGEITNISEFQVDVYHFIFKTPLTKDCMKQFTEYLQDLPMTETRSVMKIFVWLYQHEVSFKLKFSYNPRLPFKYNIKNIFEPGRVRRLLLSHGHDDLMSCSLELIAKKEIEEGMK